MAKDYDKRLDSDCYILESALVICYSSIPVIPNVHYPNEDLGQQFKADVVENLQSINKMIGVLTNRMPLGVPNHKKASFVAHVLQMTFIKNCNDYLNPDFFDAQFVFDEYVKWQNAVKVDVDSIVALDL